MGDHTAEGDDRVCGHYPATNQLLLLSSCSCSSFTSFSTSHASSSSFSVWGVWSHSQKCLKLPSSSSGAEFSASLCFGLSLPRLLRRWGGSFGGGGLGGTLVAGLAGLGIPGTGQRLMVPPPLSSSWWDWASSCLGGGCCLDEEMDFGWTKIQTRQIYLFWRKILKALKS